MWAEVRQDYESYLEKRFPETSTARHYGHDVQVFGEWMGEREPEAVNARQIDEFVEAQWEAGLKSTTIQRRLASLHGLFGYRAMMYETGQHNPVVWKRHGMKRGRKLPRDISDEDLKRLLAVITDEQDRAVFGIMAGAGLRVSEVSGLCVDDVYAPSLEQQWARMRIGGKGRKERIVWLTPAVWEKVETWLAQRPPVAHDYVFINQHGKRLQVSGIQYRLQGYCQQAKVRCSCHQLRHTFARQMVEHGMPVASLARLLGHASLTTTQGYINGADPTLQAAFQQAMKHLDQTTISMEQTPSVASNTEPLPADTRCEQGGSEEELQRLCQRLDEYPEWYAIVVRDYLRWSWHRWKATTAYTNGYNLLWRCQIVWNQIIEPQQICDWEQLSPRPVQMWLNTATKKTARLAWQSFCSLLRFAQAQGKTIDPQLFHIILPQQTHDPLPRHLTEAQFQHLEQVVMEQTNRPKYTSIFDRAYFLTLAYTGIRLHEVRGIVWQDVDFTHHRLLIRDGKNRHDRMVFLIDKVEQSLRTLAHIQGNPQPTDAVFRIKRGWVPTDRTLQRKLAQYDDWTGFHVSPHQLRHTFATRLLNAGMPIYSIQKLLGHKDLQTTQVYARVYDKTVYRHFQQAMASLDALSVDNWPQLVSLPELQSWLK